jgi:hypothetical protein
MPTLNDFITEIITGEYGLDIVNYGKDSNGDFQPFEVDVNGKQYVINEATATKLDTLIAKDFATETKLEAVRSLLELVEGKDFATETTLDNRLSSLETKIDTLLNSQDVDDNIKVSQNGSKVSIEPVDLEETISLNQGETYEIIVTPPENEIWNILKFNAGILSPKIQEGATSGNYYISLRQEYTVDIGDTYVFSESKNYDALFYTDTASYIGHWQNDIYHKGLEMLRFTNNAPVKITILNNTDVDWTDLRLSNLYILKEVKYIG